VTDQHNVSKETEHGTTVLISHRVLDGQRASYENWLDEISAACKTQPGYLDTQVIRPIASLTDTYTVIIRFASHEHMKLWMHSLERKQFIGKVRPILASDDDYKVHSGLEFLFAPEEANDKVPTRWKQFLVTWSVVYPLVLLAPMIVNPLMRQVGLPDNPYLSTLFVTCMVVLLLVYLVMPHYTKLVHKWLYK
jgi:antibiotic biosynthesis monooxygenase (ABM) superfamily enzyme